MQFLAHLPLDGHVISVFFCQNDPGMCDDWDATGGGNHAYVFAGQLQLATVPAEGVTQLGATTRLRLQPEETATQSPILGRVGGEPDWLQHEETPRCSGCSTPMTFAAELEEGYDFATAANFGGRGRGYVFRCDSCSTAAFLWQR